MAVADRWRSSADAGGPFVVDASVAVLLLGMVVVQVAGSGGVDGGSAARFLLLAPAVTLPLAWRRRAPLVTVVVVAGAVSAQSLVTAPLPAFGEFLAVMLATYSVAAHASGRVAALGLLAAAGAVVVQGVRDPSATSSFEFVYGVVYFGGAWLLGRAARHRRLHETELEQRAARLEREREHRAEVAVAEERARIARELHDVIAHCVSVIVVQAGAAEEVAEKDAPRARAALGTIRAVGNEALAEMRRLLGVLRESDEELGLDPQPGVARLHELVEHARAAGLDVQVVVDGEARPLPPGVDLAVFRVVQEALTNVRRHAHTDRACVLLRYGPDAIDVNVTDGGRGPTRAAAEGAGQGRGLTGMRERVELYGGTLTAHGQDGGGFTVRARLPTAARDAS